MEIVIIEYLKIRCFMVIGLVALPVLSDTSFCFDSIGPGTECVMAAYPTRPLQ